MSLPIPHIDPKQRELYLRILDGYQPIHLVTHRLHFLDSHFPPAKIEAALKWLISNGYTGQKFVLWFGQSCKNSDLEMHRILLMVVDNAKLLPVVAGRNFKI